VFAKVVLKYIHDECCLQGESQATCKVCGNKSLTGRNMDLENPPRNKLFVPFSEELLAAAGSPFGELVPFQLGYQCVRLLDGTYDFSSTFSKPCSEDELHNHPGLVHAA
jgi:hypothetical protein